MDAFFEDMDELNRRTIKCAPYPSKWKKFSDRYDLAWKKVEFSEEKKEQIPEKPGIYCFFVGHEFGALPPVGYALYVGIVGISEKQKSLRTLRRRYAEYLSEKDNPAGRNHVRWFLNVFKGELVFLCAVSDMSPDDLKAMERALNDALMPPFSKRDFSAAVATQRNAWQ